MSIYKGFIKNWNNDTMLPITRGELVLDEEGKIALKSEHFLAQEGNPGLVTADERAYILSLKNPDGNSSNDINAKLDAINSGLRIGTDLLQYYTLNGSTLSTKNYTISGSDRIKITKDAYTNTFTFDLEEINLSAYNKPGILKNIYVDKYGRVDNIECGGITNDELPDTLTSKTLTNSTLSNCTTDSTISNDYHIVNKKYVDDKIAGITTGALGALKFEGSLNGSTAAVDALAKPENSYFKVSANFELSGSYFEPYSSGSISLKAGDTLIIWHNTSFVKKFILVPSGDEIQTSVTILDSTNSTKYSKVGDVNLKFTAPFKIETNNNTATVDIRYASTTSDGIITSDLYTQIKNATAKSMSYVPTVNTGFDGYYEIGKISFGDESSSSPIYGVNTTYDIGLNGSNNPYLQLKEITDVKTSIQLVGGNGIEVTNDNNSAKFTIKTNHSFLKTTADGLSLKMGSVSNEVVDDGLTSYSEFNTLSEFVISSTLGFDRISNSLNSSTYDYHYGSAELIKAITLDI